jgi:co-chaperonin GroES (HSP10)
MKITPRPGRIYAVLNSVEERMSRGGIIIPDKHSEQTRIGTIESVGNDITDLKPGDRILVSYYTGVVVDMPELRDKSDEGVEIHRIYTPSEVLATIEG